LGRRALGGMQVSRRRRRGLCGRAGKDGGVCSAPGVPLPPVQPASVTSTVKRLTAARVPTTQHYSHSPKLQQDSRQRRRGRPGGSTEAATLKQTVYSTQRSRSAGRRRHVGVGVDDGDSEGGQWWCVGGGGVETGKSQHCRCSSQLREVLRHQNSGPRAKIGRDARPTRAGTAAAGYRRPGCSEGM